MNELDDTQMLNLIKMTVEQHGCRLADIDFENHTINIEGSEEAQVQCALEIEKLLGGKG